MALKSYLLAMAFFLLNGFCIYLLLQKLLSPLRGARASAISLAVCLVITFGGVSFTTFAYFHI